MSGSGARARRKRQQLLQEQARQRNKRKPQFTPWEPMQRGTRVVDPQLIELAKQNPDVAEHMEKASEVWLNSQYVVTVYRFSEGQPDVQCLSIRRMDRMAVDNWRHKQMIKNEIAGRDVEAIELYPAWDRTVDTASQYWLWCFRPGIKLPLGFDERAVSGHIDPRFPMSRQKPFGPGEEV